MLLLLLVTLEAGVTCEATLVGRRRCGLPNLHALLGPAADGDRAGFVVHEWPDAWPQLTKPRAERRQLDRFRTDLKRAGADRYTTVAKGTDPPDFIVTRASGGGQAGVEFTQLVLEDRAAANGLFQQVRAEALRYRAEAFRHLHGHLVYLAFDNAAGLPPASKAGARSVVEALSAMRLPASATWTGTDMPDSVPAELQPIELVPGCRVAAAPFALPPPSLLFRRAGIEFALAYTSKLTETSAWAQLTRLVESHDVPGVADLIVASSAPTAAGWSFPSELIAVDLVRSAAATRSISTLHIREVLLHDWETRRIDVFVPGTPGLHTIAAGEQ